MVMHDDVALLSPDLAAVLSFPARHDEIHAAYPGLTLGTVIRADSLADFPRLVIPQPVARPVLEFGETVVRSAQKVGDDVLETWTVSSITLAAAKQQLAQLAVEIYRDKVFEVTPQEAFDAASGIVGAMQARSTRFKSKYDEVIGRILAATTAAEARAILAELEAAS